MTKQTQKLCQILKHLCFTNAEYKQPQTIEQLKVTCSERLRPFDEEITTSEQPCSFDRLLNLVALLKY
jgi:hypothetical protein